MLELSFITVMSYPARAEGLVNSITVMNVRKEIYKLKRLQMYQLAYSILRWPNEKFPKQTKSFEGPVEYIKEPFEKCTWVTDVLNTGEIDWLTDFWRNHSILILAFQIHIVTLCEAPEVLIRLSADNGIKSKFDNKIDPIVNWITAV